MTNLSIVNGADYLTLFKLQPLDRRRCSSGMPNGIPPGPECPLRITLRLDEKESAERGLRFRPFLDRDYEVRQAIAQ
jgi:hypothetical protein